MNDKPKEEIYAERFDASKKEREQLSKEAIKQHEDEKPQKKESRKFKFTKKEDLLQRNEINQWQKSNLIFRMISKKFQNSFLYDNALQEFVENLGGRYMC